LKSNNQISQLFQINSRTFSDQSQDLRDNSSHLAWLHTCFGRISTPNLTDLSVERQLSEVKPIPRFPNLIPIWSTTVYYWMLPDKPLIQVLCGLFESSSGWQFDRINCSLVSENIPNTNTRYRSFLP
jgi:hypothetical protein